MWHPTMTVARGHRPLGRLAGLVLAALFGVVQPAVAHGPEEGDSFTEPLAANLERVGRKLVDLAEAIPADRYSWSPTPEVRTTSEVLMHVAGGNFQLPAGLGGGAPAGIEIPATVWELAEQRKRWEREVVGKAEVLDLLRRSFSYAAEVIPTIADLDEQVATWGFPASKRDYLLILVGHAHEHLGQSIAYARGLGITPPWSRRPEPAVADSVATFEGTTARAEIVSLDKFGNLLTSFVASDLARLGVAPGDPLTVEACGGSADVLLGQELFDVRPGEWVAFLSPGGHLIVAISYGSAAEDLGCDGPQAIALSPAG